MNLISVAALANKGYAVLFDEKEAVIVRKSECINVVNELKQRALITIEKKNNLYMHTPTASAEQTSASASTSASSVAAPAAKKSALKKTTSTSPTASMVVSKREKVKRYL
jgi:RNA processing factor Prp31